MNTDGIILLADAANGLREGLDPEKTAHTHHLWRNGLERLAPWEEKELSGLGRVFLARTTFAAGQMPTVVCGPSSSCLDVAWSMWAHLPEWSSLITVSQWAGRGQLRREWFSPPGNVYAALRWPADALQRSGPVALAVALCLAEALEINSLSDAKGIKIKWPNDLLLCGRKVGGILIEERPEGLLAGIGLNLSVAPDDEPAGRSMPAGVLPLLEDCGLPDFWHNLVQDIKLVYREVLENKSFWNTVTASLERRLAFMGGEVFFEGHGDSRRAMIMGLSPDGGLRLCFGDATEKIVHFGSIRPVL